MNGILAHSNNNFVTSVFVHVRIMGRFIYRSVALHETRCGITMSALDLFG